MADENGIDISYHVQTLLAQAAAEKPTTSGAYVKNTAPNVTADDPADQDIVDEAY